MSEQINLVISEELLKCSADEKSFNRIKKYYHRGREQKKTYVVSGKVQDAATHQMQKLLYSYGRAIFELAIVRRLLTVNDFSFFKLKLAVSYGLGKFSKKIIHLKNKGKHYYQKLEECFERWSWSYLNSNKKQLRATIEALNDFGEKHLSYPMARFYLGRIDDVKGYLMEVQMHKCAISMKHINWNDCDLHHAYLHDTKGNRRAFPSLIDSIVNRYAVRHDEHMKHGNWRPDASLTKQDLIKLENYLTKNPLEKNFVNHPYEEKYFDEFMKKLKAGEVADLLKRALKEKVLGL